MPARNVARVGTRAATLTAASLLALAIAPGAAADTINLPSAQSDQLTGSQLLQSLGTPQERLPLASFAGTVTNDEAVHVALEPSGAIHQVDDVQRLLLTGDGDYRIRESGPVLSAVPLGDDVPVIDSGDVVWQGFCPGTRQLAADLILDPQIEAAHLPMQVTLTFVGADGHTSPLDPGARVPGRGTVTITLINTTGQTTLVPTGSDAAASPVAAALDRQLAVARDAAAPRLLTTTSGLPAQLPVTAPTTRQLRTVVPFRLNGSLTVIEQPGAGARSTSPPTSVGLNGILQDKTVFTLATKQAGQLKLDLTATPGLDPGSLAPPRRFASWTAWAAAGPDASERRTALNLLVQTAEAGARASAYSPYLGAQFGMTGSTAFHYSLAQPAQASQPLRRLTPRPVPIGLTIVGALLLATGAVLVWRRS